MIFSVLSSFKYVLRFPLKNNWKIMSVPSFEKSPKFCGNWLFLGPPGFLISSFQSIKHDLISTLSLWIQCSSIHPQSHRPWLWFCNMGIYLRSRNNTWWWINITLPIRNNIFSYHKWFNLVRSDILYMKKWEVELCEILINKITPWSGSNSLICQEITFFLSAQSLCFYLRVILKDAGNVTDS